MLFRSVSLLDLQDIGVLRPHVAQVDGVTGLGAVEAGILSDSSGYRVPRISLQNAIAQARIDALNVLTLISRPSRLVKALKLARRQSV